MESLRDVKRKMERELAKGKITPLKLEKMEIFENDYKEISTYEQFKNVLNWLLRLSEYKTGEATVLNNIYMNPVRGNNEFVRTRTAIERMQIFHKIERLVNKIDPAFDGDVRLETARCYFSLPEEWLDKCKMEYKGQETYGFLLSNPYILGLFTMCMSMRAEYALDRIDEIEADSIEKKLIILDGIREVVFDCLLLDDVELVNGLVVAKLYTIYVTE
ncbi:MAG: hypothetical protein J6K43_04800 [Lachnospiraceae bacterium]|nr:hypothetical protein [Lachnospiraceae bacterium]